MSRQIHPIPNGKHRRCSKEFEERAVVTLPAHWALLVHRVIVAAARTMRRVAWPMDRAVRSAGGRSDDDPWPDADGERVKVAGIAGDHDGSISQY